VPESLQESLIHISNKIRRVFSGEFSQKVFSRYSTEAKDFVELELITSAAQEIESFIDSLDLPVRFTSFRMNKRYIQQDVAEYNRLKKINTYFLTGLFAACSFIAALKFDISLWIPLGFSISLIFSSRMYVREYMRILEYKRMEISDEVIDGTRILDINIPEIIRERYGEFGEISRGVSNTGTTRFKGVDGISAFLYGVIETTEHRAKRYRPFSFKKGMPIVWVISFTFCGPSGYSDSLYYVIEVT